MQSHRQVLQLVPRMAPGSCGVSDYAQLLAQEWEDKHGLAAHFRVAEKNFQPEHTSSRWPMRSLERNRPGNLVGKSEPVPEGIVLQYSGYGYAKRGAPLWLAKTLRASKRRHPGIWLITMFHEVMASGPPTTSAFWMMPLQAHVARRLALLSDVIVTNCDVGAEVLRNRLGCNVQTILPVFSNLGEASHVPFEERERRVVVFSSNFGAKGPTPLFWEELTLAMKRTCASAVSIVGRAVDIPSGLEFEVNQPGILPASEVSALLARSAFGYVFLGPLLLGKSGIFAAFAAHGVVPLVQTSLEVLPDGLTGGKHYHPLGQKRADSVEPNWAGLSSNIREWYRPHSVAETGRSYVAFMDHLRSSKMFA